MIVIDSFKVGVWRFGYKREVFIMLNMQVERLR